jgi:hypothetical protein
MPAAVLHPARGSAAVEPAVRVVLHVFAAWRRVARQGVAPDMRASEGERSALASELCRSCVPNEPARSAARCAFCKGYRAGSSAGEYGDGRCAVGRVAASYRARPGRLRTASVGRVAARVHSQEIGSGAERAAPERSAALSFVFRGPDSIADPESRSRRRRRYQGTYSSRRCGATALGTAMHRHPGIRPPAHARIRPTARSSDRLVSRPHPVGRRRCAPRSIDPGARTRGRRRGPDP